MASDGSRAAVERALTEDGSLALYADGDAWALVEPWVPRIPVVPPSRDAVRARIHVARGEPGFEAPASDPALDLRGVRGWTEPDGRIVLHGQDGRVSAVVDPAALRADVRVRAGVGEDESGKDGVGLEMFAALTLASAFLLGRLERPLVHAAAVVAPDGRAWLLPGGTFSGKSTTCVNLIRAGWDYLSDDHLLLRRGDDGVTVEGWPRRFNLDQGHAFGRSRGVRARVDPEGFGPGRWRRSAPLGGVLLPRVEAELPTALEAAHPAGALAALLQGSPWLLADADAARPLLSLLRAAASGPAFRLRLGADTYGDPERLARVLLVAVCPGKDCGLASTARFLDGTETSE